jgi:hypothetical protein
MADCLLNSKSETDKRSSFSLYGCLLMSLARQAKAIGNAQTGLIFVCLYQALPTAQQPATLLLTMPPRTHIVAAAAWYHMFILLPLAHYGHDKPRLHAQHQRLRLALESPKSCLTNSRLTQDELYELAELLGIDTDEQPTGNWRFSPLERLFIALQCLSEQRALRRASLQWGWAHNSISLNLQQTITLIIDRLDAPDSRTYPLITAHIGCSFAVLSLIIAVALFCSLLFAAYSISGWTLDEQQAWMDDPSGPAEFHDCIGFVDATYVEVERPKQYALERRLYSTYKKTHAIFFLAIVDRHGQR